MTLTLALALGIGVVLGLFGGGGSILAVPVLVYVARVEPTTAVTMSLVIVGTTSVVASYAHLKKGTVQPRVALSFAAAGVVTAFVGARLSYRVSGELLMLMFAALMVVVGAFMLFARVCRVPRERSETAKVHPALSLLAGAVVGLLTGFLGVGGGFLVVPALLAFTGLGLREAVGTSLVVIAINSAAGFLGHLHGPALDLKLVTLFTALAVLGGVAGARLAYRLSVDRLRRSFAVSVIALGLAMAIGSTLAGLHG